MKISFVNEKYMYYVHFLNQMQFGQPKFLIYWFKNNLTFIEEYKMYINR